MRFYERDRDGNIVGSYARPQPGKQVERLSDDHPDVVAWRNRPEPPQPKSLAGKLIDKLVEKGVLTQAEADEIVK